MEGARSGSVQINYGSVWPKNLLTLGFRIRNTSYKCALWWTHFSNENWRWTGCVPVGEYFGDKLVKVWIWSEGALGHQLLATGGALCQPEKHQTYFKCYGSGTFIPDPRSWFYFHPGSRIQQEQKRGGKFLFYCFFFLKRYKIHWILKFWIYRTCVIAITSVSDPDWIRIQLGHQIRIQASQNCTPKKEKLKYFHVKEPECPL